MTTMPTSEQVQAHKRIRDEAYGVARAQRSATFKAARHAAHIEREGSPMTTPCVCGIYQRPSDDPIDYRCPQCSADLRSPCDEAWLTAMGVDWHYARVDAMFREYNRYTDGGDRVCQVHGEFWR
jgi:hypothetical protein